MYEVVPRLKNSDWGPVSRLRYIYYPCDEHPSSLSVEKNIVIVCRRVVEDVKIYIAETTNPINVAPKLQSKEVFVSGRITFDRNKKEGSRRVEGDGSHARKSTRVASVGI